MLPSSKEYERRCSPKEYAVRIAKRTLTNWAPHYIERSTQKLAITVLIRHSRTICSTSLGLSAVINN
jgi:hypothetical protein